MSDDFGDRMKAYEAVETSRKFEHGLPVYARIDGRSFSKFTKGLERPFDHRMSNAMIETTRYLVEQTHAKIGYTQSDEISLVWLADKPESDIFFAGKIQKMTSVLASMAAVKFAFCINSFKMGFLSPGTALPSEYSEKLPHFDCRVFQIPSKEEAANAILWRAQDAKKNAISMIARHHFSHKELQGKGQADMLEMLSNIGVDILDYHSKFRYGSFLQKRLYQHKMQLDELAKIPEKHRPLGGYVTRLAVHSISMPYFSKVINRVEVIFDGAEPEIIQPVDNFHL